MATEINNEFWSIEHQLQLFAGRRHALDLQVRGLNPNKYPPITQDEYDRKMADIEEDELAFKQTSQYTKWKEIIVENF